VKSHRTAKLERKTRETSISVSLDLDGQGNYQVSTGNGMLDHLVSQISRHSLIDISLQAKGDVEVGWHHLVEDCGIALGRAFKEALGEGRGIRRMGHALVPLDESLAMVAVDLSGRGYASVDLQLDGQMAETLPGEMVHHFLESFALEGKFNLHAKVLTGQNAHHKAECTFKALAKALRMAVEADPRSAGEVPSTKGTVG
jgi:imidazoleglycerol-phosphate dehydratase